MDFLYSGQIRQGGVDTLHWNPSSQNLFEVKILLLFAPHSPLPWRSLWKPKVPPKVDFFHLDNNFGENSNY